MKTIQSQNASRTVLTARFALVAVIMAFLGLDEVAQSQISTPFWDGTDTTGGNGINGGSGTWDLATTNWTDVNGRANGPWQGLNAIFSVTGGTVTLVNVIPTITGMQFTVNGYEITAMAGNSVQLSAATPITVDSGMTATISAPFGGVGGLTLDAAGTLVLSGLNTYTGATTVSMGTLKAGAVNTLPSQTALSVAGTFDLNNFDQSVGSLLNGGTITLGSATLTTGNDNTSTIFSGTISGTGGLTKVGTGTLTLFGTQTYTGATTVNGGTLEADNPNQFSLQTAVTVAAGATFDLIFSQSIGSLAGNGNVILELADSGDTELTTGNDNTSTDFSGTISGIGSVIKVGSGTQTLSGPNTYDGQTFILGGILSVSSLNSVSGGTASSNLGAPKTVVNGTIEFSAGTLLYTGTGETTDRIISLLNGNGTIDQSGTGLLKFTNGVEASSDFSPILTLQGSAPAGAGEIAGTIADPLPSSLGEFSTSLTKSGTGTWTLSGGNTYTGTTTINAGTLLVDGSLDLASAVTVNSGGTLGGTGRRRARWRSPTAAS